MDSIYPPALKLGDTIGVIAPSSYWDVSTMQPAIDILERAGFRLQFHPQTDLKHNQFAGTEEDKIKALHDYFKDPNINAIFCTCGGNGSIHLLDKIDYDLIRANLKIFIGFSDITILLNAISAQTGLVTFHGPTLTRLEHLDKKDIEQMLAVLTGQQSVAPLNHNNTAIDGTLWGGNLSVMQALIGTHYAPTMDNSILLLEDINDHLSRYDRMIGHMKHAGWLDKCKALLLGQFLKTQDNRDRPFGLDIQAITQKAAPNTPIIMNAPIGHGDRLCTLPIGADVALKNNQISFKPLS